MSPRVAVLRDQRGFTLAEMLVVCALLGTVMAGVLSLLMVGQQSATATMNKVDAQANARMGIDRVIAEIREAGYLPQGPQCPTAPTTPCPPYNYAFPAITAQTATAMTVQNDWNADNVIQAAAVTDPITGAQRGEQVVYSFNAGQLRRQEIGIDGAPDVVAAGIIGLTYTYLDQNNAVTATAANIRTVTITMTTQQSAGQPQVTMVHRVRLRNRPTS
ncbi:MAG: prepilin-type N-terminal cleavage/methylation domain-containing protein [Candidatus Rokubacteria bacterium]|nr:prepilin-type N-terminal cleavage/methylation domain-containing protein [Candidatus Rokubacteria bacterium]